MATKDERDFPASLVRGSNQIVFPQRLPPPIPPTPPRNIHPQFSCYATSLLIYSPSACLRPAESHYLIPTSHLRRKVRRNSSKQPHAHTSTHTPYQCFYLKKELVSLSFTLYPSIIFKNTHTYSFLHQHIYSFSNSFTLKILHRLIPAHTHTQTPSVDPMTL